LNVRLVTAEQRIPAISLQPGFPFSILIHSPTDNRGFSRDQDYRHSSSPFSKANSF
jgi:hypothetical protein